MCREGPRCLFSHDPTSSKPSTICKFYQRGACAYGERCRSHGDALPLGRLTSAVTSLPVLTALTGTTTSRFHPEEGEEPQRTRRVLKELEAEPQTGGRRWPSSENEVTASTGNTLASGRTGGAYSGRFLSVCQSQQQTGCLGVQQTVGGQRSWLRCLSPTWKPPGQAWMLQLWNEVRSCLLIGCL